MTVGFFVYLQCPLLLYYRGCRWGEGNSERCLKWVGGGCGEEGVNAESSKTT